MQRAARKLNKSQPSLSVAVKKIEEAYNIRLFSRDGYRPVLTREGSIFYQNAIPVLQSHRQLHKIAMELGSGVESEIRIVTDSLLPFEKICDFLKCALLHMKTTKLTIHEDILEGPLQSILEGRAEFAIGHCSPAKASEVEKKRVCELELVPVVKKGLRYESVPRVAVINPNTPPTQTQSSEPVWFVDHHSRKESLILGGYAWGRMNKERVLAMKDHLSVIKSQEHLRLKLDIYLMVKKGMPLGKVGQAMWNAF